MELLQCVVEGRRRGESGVASVQLLEGEALFLVRSGGGLNAQIGSHAAFAPRQGFVDCMPKILHIATQSIEPGGAHVCAEDAANPHDR